MIINNNSREITKKEISIGMEVWNRSVISLLDIRYNLIPSGELLQSYRMPASGFVYTVGKSELSLDDTLYNVEHFGLFHGGKGTELMLRPVEGWLEYYLVLYKALEPSSHRKEYLRLLEQVNPFRQQYGFSPANPLLFTEHLRKMYEKWIGPTPLNLFYGKSAFYQLVYEVYDELDKGKVAIIEPDMIAIAQKYMDEHYGETVSIQNIREMLGISNSHFHRLFTARTGQSPQEYLINRRLDATKKYLSATNCTLREIAAKCGFSDELNLMRMFRRHVHMSTTEYRDICASRMGYLPIDKGLPFTYNEKNQVSLGKLKVKGANPMFKQTKNKAILAAVLSMMLLLSACSTTSVKSDNKNNAPTTESVSNISDLAGSKIIHMEYGDVEIPKNPQNVIITYNQGDLIALGITPVGATFSKGAAFEELASDITLVDGWEINPEELMSLNPDLIIWGSYDEKSYETLSKIAPTLASDFFSMNYEDRLRFFAEIFNCEEKAEELIQGFNQKLAESKSKLNDAGLLDKNIACIEVFGGMVRAYQFGRGGNLVYNMLGLSAPEKLTKAFKDETIDLSYEVLPEYMGDFILLNTGKDRLADNKVWENLPAVKEGRLIQASSDMFWFNDILSLSAQIDIITTSMLESTQ